MLRGTTGAQLSGVVLAIPSNVALYTHKAGPSDLGLRKKLLMTSAIFKVSAGIRLLLPAKVVEAAFQGAN